MAKKHQSTDIATLWNRVRLTLEFLERAESLGSVGQDLRRGAEEAFHKGDARQLRLLVADLNELTLALPTHEREGLEAVLANQLGVDVDEERSALRNLVAKARRRGFVASEKERQRLERYLELLSATDGDPEEIDAVQELLESE